MTKSGDVIRALTGLRFPNSLMMKRTEGGPEVLLVTEMVTKCIKSYEIKGPGCLENESVWAVMPGELNRSC